MTNEELIKNWRTFRFIDSTGESGNMSDIFMLCWGETSVKSEIGDEKIVIFDVGGAMGNPSLWCTVDNDNNVWEFFLIKKDSDTFSKRNIGKLSIINTLLTHYKYENRI